MPLVFFFSILCHLLPHSGFPPVPYCDWLWLIIVVKETKRQCTYDVTLRRVRVTIVVVVGKAIGITYCECVFVAFVIQHAMRVLRIVICGLPRSTIFFHINGAIFERKKILNTKAVFGFSLQILSEEFLIVRRTERDIVNKCTSVCFM
jgi:hypothetical protein